VKSGRQKGGQDLSQGVDDRMRSVLRAGAQMEHGKNLREGINGQPEPEHLLVVAQPGAQLVQLEMWELEVAEIVLVQGLCMLASARQPGDDGGLPVAEDPRSLRRVQPFSERSQHHCYLMRGGFQTVQGSVAPSSERGAAGLTAKGLDPLGMAMRAIPKEARGYEHL
jgi:hypothetical protein